MDEEDYLSREVEDDYVPPTRQGLHTEPELCKAILRTVTPSVSLSIRSSTMSPGSGLFIDSTIEGGREIYRSEPLMSAIDAGNTSFCHSCLKDTSDAVGNSSEKQTEAKACMGCRVARFCSKKCQKDAWVKFHKDECPILKNGPNMKAQHLLVHRLIFWQQRKGISTAQGRVIETLENHFWDYSRDGERNGEILDMAMAVRQATGGKVDSGLTWRLIPAVRETIATYFSKESALTNWINVLISSKQTTSDSVWHPTKSRLVLRSIFSPPQSIIHASRTPLCSSKESSLKSGL